MEMRKELWGRLRKRSEMRFHIMVLFGGRIVYSAVTRIKYHESCERCSIKLNSTDSITVLFKFIHTLMYLHLLFTLIHSVESCKQHSELQWILIPTYLKIGACQNKERDLQTGRSSPDPCLWLYDLVGALKAIGLVVQYRCIRNGVCSLCLLMCQFNYLLYSSLGIVWYM